MSPTTTPAIELVSQGLCGILEGEGLVEAIRIWIQIGSVFRNFVDPDPYSEHGSGSKSTQVKIK